jgi:hypothetical protein
VSVLLKGALVEFMPTFLVPLPNVIVFQYNPESLTHTWTQPEAAPPKPGQTTNNPMAVKGMPGESFSFTIAVDANDEIADGSAPTAAIAEVSGVYSRLAALEMLLYPTTGGTGGLLGAVSAAAATGLTVSASGLTGGGSGPSTPVPQSTMPVVLFVWGPARIVPVRVTGLTITEKLYNGTLSPTHAEAQVSLRVLTPAELSAAATDDHVLGTLATVAYDYTLTLRQGLAVANLANAAESIIGMLPH